MREAMRRAAPAQAAMSPSADTSLREHSHSRSVPLTPRDTPAGRAAVGVAAGHRTVTGSVGTRWRV